MLARILDHLHAGNYEEAEELVIRRIVGLHTHETTSNWAVANLLEDHMKEQSYLTAGTWKRIIKTAGQIESMKKSSSKPSSNFHKKDPKDDGSSGSYKGAGVGGKSSNSTKQ